jgi:hypothetical protein
MNQILKMEKSAKLTQQIFDTRLLHSTYSSFRAIIISILMHCCTMSISRAFTSALLMADTTNALAVLGAQVDDMLQQNSTHVAFCLASPSNRRATARGGYDSKTFDAMVRSPSYAPLLGKGGGSYQVLSSSQTESNFEASVRIVQADGSSKDFDFGMSLQHASVVDEHASLEPYQLRPGHPPVWRTDMVMPSRR